MTAPLPLVRKRQEDGGSSMTMAKLLQICRENGSPSNPLAVTHLELSCQLFTHIEDCIAAFSEVMHGKADERFG